MDTVRRVVLWLVFTGMALASSLAVADPPARVGRLSLVEGGVALRIDGQGGEGPAELNWPVSSGTSLYTTGDGRTEVQLGSNTFRLAGDSAAAFTVVDDRRIAVQLIQGSLAVTARDREQAEEIDISTASGQIRLADAGRYRIDVLGRSGDVRLASRDGIAYFYRPGGEMAVQGGRQGIVYGRGGWYVEELRLDAFDDWVAARDASADAALARRHVSPRMTGYEDLDRYGEWSTASGYGAVWYPRTVPAGWAPYRYGRWAWIAPWGWTWVDEAPWGFAPFHYGRWSFIGQRWAWVPGTYIAQPVYAPALVAWVGNSGWNVSFSFGTAPALGWFPLGAWEVYYPAYRYSPAYLRQVNGGHVNNVSPNQQTLPGPPGQRIRTALANSAMPQAVTVVPASTVRTGSPVAPAALPRPDQQVLSRAPISTGGPVGTWLAPAASAIRPQPAEARSGPDGAATPAFPSSRPGDRIGRAIELQQARPVSPEPGNQPPLGTANRLVPSARPDPSNRPGQGKAVFQGQPQVPAAAFPRQDPASTPQPAVTIQPPAQIQNRPEPAAAAALPPSRPGERIGRAIQFQQPETVVAPTGIMRPSPAPVVASPPPAVSPPPRIISPPPSFAPPPAPAPAPSPPPGAARGGNPGEPRGAPGKRVFDRMGDR